MENITNDIVEISDELLAERLKHWTPIIHEGGKFYTIKTVDPRNMSFIWDPEFTGEVSIEVMAERITYHTCGYHGFFKPSIAEVLAQIPDDIQANGFYITFNDNDCDSVISTKDFYGHRAITVFVKIIT
jgi:hypothetical protein